MNSPTAKQYIEAARLIHEDEGEIEIDRLEETDAQAEKRVSRSNEGGEVETGAYVKAWVWVPRNVAESIKL